jgi:hypothetical protein
MIMRAFLLIFISFFLCINTFGQNKYATVDKSPLDMSFYPVNYPILKIQDKVSEPLVARIVYSRPMKNGRVVFGELVEFNKVWRLGANESTEVEFFQDVRIANTKIKKGRYSLFAIPQPDKWTIILNRDTDSWGAFKYDSKKDILRTDVPVQKQNESLETLCIQFEKSLNGIALVMSWDDCFAKLPIMIQ